MPPFFKLIQYEFFYIQSLLIIIASGSVFAESGYYIEEQVTTPPIFGLPKQTHFTRTWITATHLRRDEGIKQQTLLIDTGQNQAWLLQHQDSSLVQMDMATLQGLALMTMMMFGVTYDTLTGDPIIPDSIFYQTGRTRRIGSWMCKEAIIQRRQASSSTLNKNAKPVIMWVTEPDETNGHVYASILRAMMGPLISQYASFFDQLERLGGYPAELYTRAMGMEITQQLKVLEKREIPDSIFAFPKVYHKTE